MFSSLDHNKKSFMGFVPAEFSSPKANQRRQKKQKKNQRIKLLVRIWVTATTEENPQQCMRVNQCEPNLFVSYFYSRVLSTFQCSYIYLFFSFVISVIKFYAYTRAGAPNAPHNGSPNVGSVMKTQEQKKNKGNTIRKIDRQHH